MGHFDNFLQKDDLIKIKDAGITHVRVPIPHWILGNKQNPDEPWIVGNRWKYFQRMVNWCRELNLKVWVNIHTAPGSQNGFDNSGIQLSTKTCYGWDHNPNNVQLSLDVIDSVTYQIYRDNMTDVVTGFGLLNEPFGDCDEDLYKGFIEKGR